jgi:hypothetical protein
MEHIGIPKFDPKNPLHQKLAEISKNCHQLKKEGKEPARNASHSDAGGKEIEKLEKENDELVKKLLGLNLNLKRHQIKINNMGKFGFKEINEQNWLEPDEVSKRFLEKDWLRHILAPKLLKAVPDDVQALFEIARGVFVYGYFFYPLYAVCERELFRVAEAAVSRKCKDMGGPNPKSSFEKKIKWLVDKGVIPEIDILAWDVIREMRNVAFHPEYPSIITPNMAMGSLERVSEKINALFGHV